MEEEKAKKLIEISQMLEKFCHGSNPLMLGYIEIIKAEIIHQAIN